MAASGRGKGLEDRGCLSTIPDQDAIRVQVTDHDAMTMEFHAALRDGTPLLVRTVRPSDRDRLVEGFEHLSERSRRFRFMAPVRTLNEESIARLTADSTPAHYAVGALDLGTDPPTPAGIARYEMLEGSAGDAEMAVTIVDSHQRRGLGTLLFAAIARVAAEAGAKAFIAVVHGENHDMARLMRALGGTSDSLPGTGYEFRIPIARDPSIYPDTSAGNAVRAAYRLIAAQGAGWFE